MLLLEKEKEIGAIFFLFPHVFEGRQTMMDYEIMSILLHFLDVKSFPKTY
jgi:hypothetical protein